MKRLKCVAIDDGAHALKLIRNYVARIPALEILETFDNPVAGAEYLRNNPVDLLFIDINMPDITGLDLVRSLEHKPLIIFTTAYKNFAFEGFELDALDYLLKPIDFERFAKAVQKAIDFYTYRNTLSSEASDSLVVNSEYRKINIALNDIEYIQSLENYLRIHLVNAKPVLTLMPLKKILEKLPEDKFKRIHRSYVIQVSKIKSISKRKVLLISNKELPIGESYFRFVQHWENS
jgi:two-component system LytT family response regulator